MITTGLYCFQSLIIPVGILPALKMPGKALPDPLVVVFQSEELGIVASDMSEPADALPRSY